MKNVKPVRPGHAFSWSDLQEITRLFELLETGLQIEQDQNTDADAITLTRQNLRRVRTMTRKVQRVARRIKCCRKR